MARLDGKAAIITGGAAGIGAAVAQKFAFEGARVLLAGLPGDPVDDVARAIRGRGGIAESFIGNLFQELTAKECVAKAVEAFGKLDILILTGGVFAEMEHPVENLASLMTKCTLPLLQETRGVVISMRSETGGVNGPKKNEGSSCFLHAFITGLGRRGTPEQMADVLAIIASGEASFMTGTLIFATGGSALDSTSGRTSFISHVDA